MAYQKPSFAGDETYSRDCTGDACVGDEVRFERAVFKGEYPDSTFSHLDLVTGKIVRDSYGKAKGQHTFTLDLDDGSTTRIKGHNLYANGLFRKPWPDESVRDEVLNEKHARGSAARKKAEAIERMMKDEEEYENAVLEQMYITGKAELVAESGMTEAEYDRISRIMGCVPKNQSRSSRN